MVPFGVLPSITGLINVVQLSHIQGKIHHLTGLTEQVLQIAQNTMLLSGMNLAVSGIGFAVMHQRLNAIDAKLDAIKADVKIIRELLERKERAHLRATLENVLKAEQMANPTTRTQALLTMYQTLGSLVQEYDELFQNATSVEEALVYEEYYCLVALARIRCTLEMQEFSLAERDLEQVFSHWSSGARRLARDLLINEHPERFLYRESLDDLPTAVLVQCLDFAHDTADGYAWIDTLRTKMQDYHADSDFGVRIMRFKQSRAEQRRRDCDVIAPALQKLTARSHIFEGYRSEVAILRQQQIAPAVLEQQVRALAHHAVDGFLILEPVSQVGALV